MWRIRKRLVAELESDLLRTIGSMKFKRDFKAMRTRKRYAELEEELTGGRGIR